MDRDFIILDPALLTGKALMRSIVREVAETSGVLPEDIMGRVRTKKIARARLKAYAAIRATGRFSYPKIGGFFDRDHTTVLTGIARHEARALARQEAA